MTGAYIRVKRNDKWENVKIDQLTDEELDEFTKDHPEDGWKWAKFLAKWIRDNVATVEDL